MLNKTLHNSLGSSFRNKKKGSHNKGLICFYAGPIPFFTMATSLSMSKRGTLPSLGSARGADLIQAICSRINGLDFTSPKCICPINYLMQSELLMRKTDGAGEVGGACRPRGQQDPRFPPYPMSKIFFSFLDLMCYEQLKFEKIELGPLGRQLLHG